MIKIDSIVMGPLENNVYIVRCEGEQMFTFVVDPTAKVPKILDALSKGENTKSKPDAVICTHFHTDHTGGLAQLVRETGARVYAGKQDAPHIEVPRGARDEALHLHEACKVDERVGDGDALCAGDMKWRFIHTPGHSAGGICLYKPAIGEDASVDGGVSATSGDQSSESIVAGASAFGENASTGATPDIQNDVIVNGKNYGNIPVLFSGDTLFAGVTGRTDFFSSSDKDMRESLKKLSKLPDNTLVLPGHNEFSTIGAERKTTFHRWGVE